ncbi:MAG: nuclear transport factor 2 family protein [Elusimicrobiales bacterium]|jgi:hypothetical protein
MKHLLLAITLLSCAGPAAAAPKTYAEAQNDLAWLSHSAAFHRNTLTQAIKTQTSNLEVMNRLMQAKIKVEEMIQRENTAKACKVVEYGFTAATLGAGGIAAAATDGLSVLSKEGFTIAAKYIAPKAALDRAKDAAGVPGYSDSVKVGVYIFNKADENELKSGLSKDNIDILLKAGKLLEDEADGRTLREKLPDLRQLISDMQEQLDQNASTIKAADKLITDLQKEGQALVAEAGKLKEEERKKAEKDAEAAKKKGPSGLVKTEISRPAQIPPSALGPKDSPEEKKRKIQESIDRYLKSLTEALDADRRSADAAWTGIKRPGAVTHYYVSDDAQDALLSFAASAEGLTGPRTYSAMQSVEENARGRGEWIKAYRSELEDYKNEIRSKIEPVITDMAAAAGQWRSVRQTYGPQGFYVPNPPEVEKTTAWSAYYEGPLAYVERYKAGTEGLDAKFAALAAEAAAQKDAIYAEAKTYAEKYAEKTRSFRDALPGAAAAVRAALDDFNKKSAPVASLPDEFVREFAYDGKHDLADLESRINAAKQAFSAAQAAQRSAALLYYGLADEQKAVFEMGSAPLMSEAGFISYGAKNQAHRTAMETALKPVAGYSPRLDGLEGVDTFLRSGPSGLSDAMFGAEEGLRCLRAAETRMLAAAGAAAAELRTGLAADLSSLAAAGGEEYAGEMERLFKPSREADAKLNAIQDEVRSTFFFDPAEELKPQKLVIKNSSLGPMVDGKQPILLRTGFYPASVKAKRAELDAITAAFWDSPAGKAITEARRLKELETAQNDRDPGAAAARKMYEGFKSAYEARNTAKIMSFVADDWTAGDGTTAADLEEQFTRIFRLFDEISVEITNLQVIADGNKRYAASYNITIRSRIYKKNIKREESSSVYEHLEVSGGAARIKKTESGGYWSVK